ncbi:hypothetical protein [Mucilaginibacter pineti]|nr:hypothetical protein [Mucilaginibacter pineti]
MMETGSSAETGHQPTITAALTAGIFFTLIIYSTCTEADSDDALSTLVWVFPVLSVLTLGYVLTYRDKLSRILLGVFVLISIIGYLYFAFVKGMAAAFSHG